MSYVPPHLRKKQGAQPQVKDEWHTVRRSKKPEPKDEFPALVAAPIQTPSKMDFKELFARRKEIKKRQKKMKYGWIKLTKRMV